MRGIGSITQKNARIGAQFGVVGNGDKPFFEKRVDIAGGNLDIDDRRRFFRVGRSLAFVRFARDPKRIGANTQIRVHCDEHGGLGFILVTNIDRCLQNGQILRPRFETHEQIGAFFGNGNAQCAAVLEGYPDAERPGRTSQAVEQPSDGARTSTAFGPFAFELVDFFDGVDRNDQIVVLELEDRLRIVKEDVCVENVVFPHVRLSAE